MRYKTIKIGKMFNVYPGKLVKNTDYIEGSTPYISESAKNNGINKFIDINQTKTNLTILENCLSMSSKTGKLFYHPYRCAIGQQVHGLVLKDKYKKFQQMDSMLMLAILIEFQTQKANFGNQINSKKLVEIEINLPIDQMGNIKLENNLIQHLITEDAKVPVVKENNEEILYSEVKLGDIFSETELYSTKSVDFQKIPPSNLIDGDIPYISRTSQNNGIKTLITEFDGLAVNEGNCITIGLDTQTVFYQPYKFVCGQNIHILRPDEMNFKVGIFLATVLEMNLKKFSWGSNGATISRVRDLVINLPIDSGKLDIPSIEKYVEKMINE